MSALAFTFTLSPIPEGWSLVRLLKDLLEELEIALRKYGPDERLVIVASAEIVAAMDTVAQEPEWELHQGVEISADVPRRVATWKGWPVYVLLSSHREWGYIARGPEAEPLARFQVYL